MSAAAVLLALVALLVANVAAVRKGFVGRNIKYSHR